MIGPRSVATTVCSYCTTGAGFGVKRPAVAGLVGEVPAARQEGLDRQHQPAVHAARVAVGPGGDFFGVFVQRAADPVAGEVADQGVAALGRRSGRWRCRCPLAVCLAGLRRCRSAWRVCHRGRADRARGSRCRVGRWPRYRRRSRPSRRDVDVHQIARGEDARAGDAVGDFLVHADAGGTGEVVGGLRGGGGAGLVQQRAADVVEFARGHADIAEYFRHGCGRCARFATPACSVRQWHDGLAALRTICRDSGLKETVKWGHPCYMHTGRNIAIIGAFRDDFRLTFFNAALMRDPDGRLEKQGPNTRHPDMIRLTSAASDRQQRSHTPAPIWPRRWAMPPQASNRRAWWTGLFSCPIS